MGMSSFYRWKNLESERMERPAQISKLGNEGGIRLVSVDPKACLSTLFLCDLLPIYHWQRRKGRKESDGGPRTWKVEGTRWLESSSLAGRKKRKWYQNS